MGHELHLVADIRVASADVRFGQDENTHGRFPGGGSAIRFPREAGWGNATRDMLTADHWAAEKAYRMGVTQEIAPNPADALNTGIGLAQKIAACGLLGSKITLESAHLSLTSPKRRRWASSALWAAQPHRDRQIGEQAARPSARPSSRRTKPANADPAKLPCRSGFLGAGLGERVPRP